MGQTPAGKKFYHTDVKKTRQSRALDMIYLDDRTLSWANKGLERFNTSVVQKD